MTAYTYENLLSWSREKLRPWQQDALRRVLVGQVNDADIQILAEICLSAVLDNPDPRLNPANTTHVRPSGDSLPTIALLGIRDIKRVNALGPGPIAFAGTGLNVIYGDNASGKSGFTRILKKACRAKAPGPAIRGNVFEADSREPASANIDFSINDTHECFAWVDGVPTRDQLALVTIFDADCAKWQVDKPNVIEYTPELLAVFRDLAVVFRRVGAALQSKRAGFLNRPAAIDELKRKLDTSTSVRMFLDSLSAYSDPKELAQLSTLNHSERERMAELEQVLKVDPALQWREDEARGRRVITMGDLFHNLGTMVSDAAYEQLASKVQKAKEAEEAAQGARTVLSRHSKLEGVGTDVWRSLWEAARVYSQQIAYLGEEFPVLSEKAVCVLCQQSLSLDEQAKERLRSFEEFVQGEIQLRADKARADLDATIKSIRSMPIPKRSRDAVREIGLSKSEEVREIRLFLISVKRRRLYLLSLASSKKTKNCPILLPKPDTNRITADINEKIRTLQVAASAEGRRKLIAEKNELSARDLLSSYRDDVAKEISRLQFLAILDAAIAECTTYGVTLEQGAAEKALITSKLQDRFRSHLISFGFSELQVDLLPQGGEQGVRPYGCRLTANPNVPAGEILSEGERTCVALAGLLAELDTTDNRSGIVLDDPVCSLDHNYRERITRHLAEEATKRQIIVFTHDIVFLFLLQHYSGNKGVPCQPMTLRRGGPLGGHGRAELEPPWESMTVKQRVARMRRTLTAARQLLKNNDCPGYEKEARDVYSELRQTWERAVEEVLLNGAILRFGLAVETQRLRKVADDLRVADVEKVDDEMSYCSKFMHDPPGSLSRERPPGPDIIEADITKLNEWVKGIRARRDSNNRAQVSGSGASL